MSGHNEEQMDAWLREHLRAGLPEPPVDEVDWPELRRRIALRAQPALARLRRSARKAAWWDYAARWARPVLPAAIAAAAALLLLLGRLERAVEPAAAAVATSATASERITVEAAIGAAPQDAETRILFVSADQDALLRAAVNGR